MINVEAVASMRERLLGAGFTQTEAVELLKADLIAHRIQRLSESINSLATTVKHRR